MSDGEIPVRVTSGFGGNTQRGFVSLGFGDQKPHTMSSEEARRIARLLLECAESADQDAFIVSFGMGSIGLDQDHAAMLLLEFRKHRNKVREADV